jgi:hypothetical protein
MPAPQVLPRPLRQSPTRTVAPRPRAGAEPRQRQPFLEDELFDFQDLIEIRLPVQARTVRGLLNPDARELLLRRAGGIRSLRRGRGRIASHNRESVNQNPLHPHYRLHPDYRPLNHFLEFGKQNPGWNGSGLTVFRVKHCGKAGNRGKPRNARIRASDERHGTMILRSTDGCPSRSA